MKTPTRKHTVLAAIATSITAGAIALLLAKRRSRILHPEHSRVD